MKKTKLEKGITLVALIITIVVLLILAVVSIGAVRNSGIIGHATNTSDAWKEAQKEENTYLEGYEEKLLESTGVKVKYTDEGVPVPLGFKVVEGTRDTGLVIENKTEGSQFVWIPVNNIEEFAESTSGTDANGRTNYQGVLYNFSGTTATEKTSYGQDTTSYREPANLSTTYDSTSKMSIWTETLYQGSFNKMVESVAKYGGFYVGRYETSMNGNVAQSKSGETPMNNVTWYQAYTNSQTYSASGVVAEMIWGCQWDAMMRFILKGKDTSHVTAKTNVSHDLSSTYKTGRTDYLDTVKYQDIASNIYDLEGNVREWTQEANGTYSRVQRGGSYNMRSSPSFRDGGLNPTSSSSYDGSRLTLYVEL